MAEQALTSSISPMDFQEEGCLGRGTFGRVSLVRPMRRDLGLGKDLLALKQIDKRVCTTSDRRKAAVLRERKMLNQVLGCPFCLQLLCCFQTPYDVYFVTEYHSGGSLANYLKSVKRKVEGQQFIYLAAELTQGIAFIHERGIIHRDIKPGNVVIGRSGHVVIIDFGNAFDSTDYDPVTRHLGTRSYKAPEMFMGEDVDRMVDWWSLGMTLLVTITKLNPINSLIPKRPKRLPLKEELREIFQNFKADDYLPSTCIDETRDFIRSLLHISPTQRLGAHSGAEEVKSHSMFARHLKTPLHWTQLAKQALPPPISPPSESKQRNGEGDALRFCTEPPDDSSAGQLPDEPRYPCDFIVGFDMTPFVNPTRRNRTRRNAQEVNPAISGRPRHPPSRTHTTRSSHQ